MICSNCYKTRISVKHDVSHWWNNSPEMIFVCSDKCYNELEQHAKNGTWLTHKPEAIFGKPKSTKKVKGPMSLTDKQFDSSL